jgi:hypothetical protein
MFPRGWFISNVGPNLGEYWPAILQPLTGLTGNRANSAACALGLWLLLLLPPCHSVQVVIQQCAANLLALDLNFFSFFWK